MISFRTVLFLLAILILTACGGGGGGDGDGDTVPADNSPPVKPNASPEFAQNHRSIVIEENTQIPIPIDASDPDGDTLVFSLLQSADQSLFTINNDTRTLILKEALDFENPLDADQNNVYEVTIGVSDGKATASQAISVTVVDVNEAPLANAGDDIAFLKGEVVTLSCDGSVDAEGSTLTYTWEQTSGTPVVIERGDTCNASAALPDTREEFEFSLTVSDGTLFSEPDVVRVTSRNYAGPNLTVDTNPFSAIVGSVERFGRGQAVGVHVQGNRAYTAGNNFEIVDISDKESPVRIGSYETAGNAQDVVAVGSFAYVADGSNGLLVLDISDDTAPVLVGAFAFPEGTNQYSHEIVVEGFYAYVADGYNGLQIFDISDPSNPRPVGSATFSQQALGLSISGGHVYVAASSSGFYAVNVSDPANPAIEAQITFDSYANTLAVQGDYAFVLLGYGLAVIDITSPSLPTVVAAYVDGEIVTDNPQSIDIRGARAYVASGEGLVSVLDIADSENPQLLGTYPTPDGAHDIKVVDSYAYVASGLAGLQILDISTPIQNQNLQHFLNIGARSSVVTDNFAYVAGSLSGISVLYVPRVEDLRKAATLNEDMIANGMVLSGDYLYITNANTDVKVIDISNNFMPSLAASFTDVGYVNDIDVVGDHAYLTDIENGLMVLDVSNLPSIDHIKTIETADSAWLSTVQDNRLFLADRTGINFFDISTPANPLLLNTIRTRANVSDIEVAGNYLYLVYGFGGLHIYDITDIENPFFTGFYHGDFAAQDVIVAGSKAYISSSSGGTFSSFQVVDVSDPYHPTLMAFNYLYGNNLFGQDIQLRENSAFIAADGSGYHIINIAETISINNFSSAGIQDTLNYEVTWQGLEYSQLKCFVTTGSCGVDNIDKENKTAKVRWVPSTAGDAEILIAVGNYWNFLAATDQIVVE